MTTGQSVHDQGQVTAAPAALAPVPQRIADELAVGVRQVEAAVALLDDGSTVPFIARYRKEATGGLDDAQLRTLADRLVYLRELEERRGAVLESVSRQGKLTEELARAIATAETKARLEDVYLPYKPKRRTKAQIAREAGLEPLLDTLLGDPAHNPIAVAHAYVSTERGDRRRRRGPRWGPGDPGRTVHRGRRPAGRVAGADLVARPPGLRGSYRRPGVETG